MLKNLIDDGFGKKNKLNCAEKIFYGANEVYNLGLNEDTLKMASGFGGGMSVESACGALTASVMVLSRLFSDNDKGKIKGLTEEMLINYKNDMGDIDCKPLKKKHKSLIHGCDKVVLKAAEHLDKIVVREIKK